MSARGIDVEKLKQLVGSHALTILEKRGMEAVGSRDAAEVQIRNRSPKRVAGKARGDENPSASWNAAKGLFVDFADPSFNGDLIHVVAHCDDISFVEAAKRVAEDVGVELPMMQPSGANRTSASANRTADNDRSETTNRVDSAREDKIAAARRIWNEAVPLRDSWSESYLEARGIVLAQDDHWLRSNEAADYWAPPVPPDTKPTKIATMPALVAALTVAGAGEPVAVALTYFEHSDDGEVTLKPRIVDPKSGREFKNKRVRGSKAGAGAYVGLHLLTYTIVVTEGVEDALSAVMAEFPAVAKLSTDLANLQLPPKVKRVVLAADNDGPGAAGFAKAAPIYRARGCEVLALSMPDGIKDLNELLTTRGADNVRRVLDEAQPWRPSPGEDAATATDDAAPKEGESTEKLYERVDDVTLQATDYLIKGLLARRAISLIYGESTVGKSFAALTIAAHVATGRQFGRHRVHKASVIYFALEGQAEFRKRLIAVRGRLGPFGDHFVWISEQLNLSLSEHGNRGEQIIVEAAQRLQAQTGETVGLIVIDTLRQALGSDDENDASAVSQFLIRIARIRQATGAAVVLVHHVGKDPAKGPRGSSALMPAMDFMAVLERNERQRYLKVLKNKDGVDGQQFRFELEVVELGTDDEGEVITSCVAHFDFSTPQSTKKARKVPSRPGRRVRHLSSCESLQLTEIVRLPAVNMGYPTGEDRQIGGLARRLRSQAANVRRIAV